MAEDPVQTHASHVRWLPPWHFFAIPILAINALVQLYRFISAASHERPRQRLVSV